jgi:Ca2+-binding EF-hand superfamily protein
MIKNGIDVTESEVNNLFKRLDIDRDNRVTFSEFKRLFGSSFSSSRFDTDKSTNSTYEIRSNKISSFESPRTHTLRSPLRTNNTSRLYSPLRERTINVLNKSVDRIDLNRSTARTPLRSTGFDSKYGISNGFSDDKSSFSSLRNSYVSYEEETFITFLRELLEIENDIEKAKIDLTYKTDFNVEDAFRNFELDGRGYVTDLDFNYGLNAFDIFTSREEVALLIKRYDINNEGVLR